MGKKRLRTIMEIAAALMAAAGIVLAICPVSIKAGTDSGKTLEDGKWQTVKLGTQSDKMKDASYDAASGTLQLNSGSNGKMANTGQSGFVMYYTKVKSDDYNVTVRGRFHVTKVDKADNQSSFGIIVTDSLGSKDASADYLNQAEICAATKNEATKTCIPGIRTLFGNIDASGKSNNGGTCDVTQYFDKDATVFKSDNAKNLYYNFEVVKDSNGYVFNYYSDDWSKINYSKRIYNPEKLLKQDKENVYIGFYASRIGTVEVTDISYEQHTPTAEEKAAVDKSAWADYDKVSVKTFNGTTTSSDDYIYRFTGNVKGTLTVKDDHGNIYIDGQEISSGDAVKFALSDKGISLPMGDTTFITTVKPYENAINADGSREYSDRLLLKDYSPVEIKDKVTRKDAVAAGNGIVYVSPQGAADASGTKEAPVDIATAAAYARAGQTIVLLDGTYNMKTVLSITYSVSGTKDAPITLKAENAGRAVFNGSSIAKSSDAVISLKGNYWNIYGIDVCNASDGTKGIHVSGSNNTIEMCNIYENGSTGLQISYSGGEPSEWWPSGNQIKNCSSYYNCDSKQNDADGFAAKLSVGSDNVFDGCIAYSNADDGYDLYAKDTEGYGPIEPVTIQNSLAYNNGMLKDGSNSKASGNGFKLGGEGLTGKHVLKNCVAWNNGGSGIMSNNGPDCRVYNCTSVDNGHFSRTGGTDSRNNYQLTPKNGEKYSGNTGYVLENVISFYTAAVTDSGKMSSDKFTLKGQNEDVIYKTNNYICKNIDSRECVNKDGNKVSADWFESVDYNNIVPTRDSDGSIDMHGLFVLTDKAPSGVGAVIGAADSYDTAVISSDVPKQNKNTGKGVIYAVFVVIIAAAAVAYVCVKKKKH